MTTSTSKKTHTTKAKKSAPPRKNKTAQKVAGCTTQSSRASDTSSRCPSATVEDDEDDKPTSVDGTLDADGDTVLEEVIEDEESELSEFPTAIF